MRKRKTYAVVAAVLAACVGIMGIAAACGGSGGGDKVTATTAQGKAKQILGHDPTGLAKAIVARGNVVVANDAAYAPQSSLDKKTGKLVGFDVDVAEKVGALLGLKVKFKNPPWLTVIPGLRAGKWDVSIGSMSTGGPDAATHQKAVDFAAPYYYTPGQVFVKKGGVQIKGAQDLAGQAVGVGAGTSFYDYLKASTTAKVKTYTNIADAYPDLESGKIPFIMTAAQTGGQAIAAGEPIVASGKPLFYDDMAFATKKGEADWLALLNYAVAEMHKDGSLSAMSKQWYDGLDLSVKK